MAGFDRFGLVMIVVTDMDRSVAFYRDVMGLKLQYSTPHWSQFDVGGVTLGLHPETDTLKIGSRPQTCQFGFFIDDVDATFADLTNKGASPVQNPVSAEFGNFALVGDPDGYVIQLAQMKQG